MFDLLDSALLLPPPLLQAKTIETSSIEADHDANVVNVTIGAACTPTVIAILTTAYDPPCTYSGRAFIQVAPGQAGCHSSRMLGLHAHGTSTATGATTAE